ncbi:hypothetical protein MRX96_009360 [Rhipicephalus microplus]
MLREDVLDLPLGSLDCILLALNINEAFDRVSYEAFQQGFQDIGCRQHIYKYVQDFHTSRTTTIGLGTTHSPLYSLRNRETLRGFLHSLLLFNLATRRMILDLQDNPDLAEESPGRRIPT